MRKMITLWAVSGGSIHLSVWPTPGVLLLSIRKWTLSCPLLKGKDASAFDRAGLQSLEREVGVFEPEVLRVGPDGDGRRLPQEVQAVLLRVGRHAPDHSLPEQLVVVIDRRDRRQMDAGDVE